MDLMCFAHASSCQQIKWFMAYQYAKTLDLPVEKSGTLNPYHALLSQLSGVNVTKPLHKPAAYIIFQQAYLDMVLKPQIKALIAEHPGTSCMKHQNAVTNHAWNALTPQEQAEYEKEAVQIHLIERMAGGKKCIGFHSSWR